MSLKIDKCHSLTWSEERIFRTWADFIQKERSLSRRLLILVLISLVTISVTALFYPQSDLYYPTLMTLAAILMAIYGGWALGVAFTIMVGLVIDFCYTTPIGRILVSPNEQRTFLLITFISAIVGGFVGSLRFAFFRLELARQKLETAVQSRDEMIGIISHELKNPLTAVQTGVELIQKLLPRAPENEKVHKLIDRLTPSIFRMNGLISDLLDVTRLESNVLPIQVTSGNLAKIAQDVVNSQDLVAQEKLVDLRSEIDSDLPPALVILRGHFRLFRT